MELHVEPRVVKTWKNFLKENPHYSMALDGYVKGRPKIHSILPYANFNHHEGVPRSMTKSTCSQVYHAIKLRELDHFKVAGKLIGNIYVNDPDQDTSTSVWELRNQELVEKNERHQIKQLIFYEDAVDTSGGIFPDFDPKKDIFKQLAWIYHPYTDLKIKVGVKNMTKEQMEFVINECGERITKWVNNEAKMIELNTDYEVIGGGPGWAMVKEIGPYARNKMFFEDNLRAIISVRKNPDETYTYTGLTMGYVKLPWGSLPNVYNKEEGIEKDLDRWSGGTKIWGAPRERGSKITPQKLEKITNDYLRKKRFID